MSGLRLKRTFRVPLIYGVFSILWILFSDRIAFAASPDLEQAGLYSTIKGLFFVISSTLLIYFLLKADESHKETLLNEIAAVQRGFNLLFEDNPQPMWIYDNHTFEIMAVNPAACRVYGYSAPEFRKLKITDLRRKEDIPALMKTIAEYKDELRQSGPWEHVKKGGESIIVKVISHPLRSAGFDATLVSIIDLTEHQQTLNELGTAMQERDDFEAFGFSVSHDLKAPLRAVIGYSDILRKEYQSKLDEEGNKFVNQIYSAGKSMNEMLDDILTLTGISRQPFEYERLNFSDILENTVNELKILEPERKVIVRIQPNMKMIADRGAIKLVAQNLINNAWKYTKQQAKAEIEAGCMINENEETVFFVKDNGLGFDQSDAEFIFEPFKRATRSPLYEGLGIGLSIVKRVIERHEGKIWVEAEPGKGACFFFTMQSGGESTGR